MEDPNDNYSRKTICSVGMLGYHRRQTERLSEIYNSPKVHLPIDYAVLKDCKSQKTILALG